jgi:hypothetical protein
VMLFINLPILENIQLIIKLIKLFSIFAMAKMLMSIILETLANKKQNFIVF